ncbi:MAG TPA: hypothetical protein VHX88_21980, partial [Solirubrobacteraceae bacterium]|nr:hypothetical protein [Solirubrobacteraceae bacterium]
MTAPSDDAARAHAAASVRAALTSLPLGAALLSAFAERRDVWLVGGAVRDLLLGGLPKELDLVVDGAEVDAVAAGLVERLSGEVRGYDRFGTASVCTPLGGVDLARARREHYRTPGALPMVSPAPLEEDLQRRDFTVNAIAVALGPDPARLCAHPRALADLDGRQLRVLHDASFIDDPTRLLRLARYEARLGFAIEPHTALLAGAAIAGGALATVSGARIGAELRLLLAEPARVAALLALGRAGLLATLDPGLEVDRGLLEAALELAPPDASPEVIALAAVGVPVAQREGPDALRSLLDHLCVPARERGLVLEAAASAAPLSAALAAAIRPSEIRA